MNGCPPISQRYVRARLVLGLVALGPLAGAGVFGQEPPTGHVYFVRQRAGDDRNDGQAADRAWRSLAKLSAVLRPGDTAYVGPGLYREQLVLAEGGEPGRRIRLVADVSGRHTGDSPGPVIVSGAEPLAAERFSATGRPGVFVADIEGEPVRGVVEMDGSQFPFTDALETREHSVDGREPLDVVGRSAASFFYDDAASKLYVHTTDGGAPRDLEAVVRTSGIYLWGKRHVTVTGFIVRHTQSAGITFGRGADRGIAVGNQCFGSHHGIQVLDSDGVVVSGNRLFLNDNSGVYFVSGSEDGLATNNVLYGNLKGIRWGSGSDRGRAIGNVAFENLDAGISLEDVNGLILVDNRLMANAGAQLKLSDAGVDSDGNCFEPDEGGPAVAIVRPRASLDLLAYRRVSGQDGASREGGCGVLPERTDVGALSRPAPAAPRASPRSCS